MKAVLALCTALALSGCATASVDPTPALGSSADDCAVIAAVATEHYGFNSTDRLPPPVKFDPGFDPQCDWSDIGLVFVPYDEQASGDPRERQKWVSFGRPRYDENGASIRSGIMHGPLAGMGVRCRMILGFAGWTVGECETTWIS